MNRNFPPETIRACDHCGRDITCVITPEGWLEANDQRDYVWAETDDVRDHVFVCADCRVAHGLDDG